MQGQHTTTFLGESEFYTFTITRGQPLAHVTISYFFFVVFQNCRHVQGYSSKAFVGIACFNFKQTYELIIYELISIRFGDTFHFNHKYLHSFLVQMCWLRPDAGFVGFYCIEV